MFMTPWLCISVVLGEKICFHEENPSRGASVTLSRHFRKQFRGDSSPFFLSLFAFFFYFQLPLSSSYKLLLSFPISWPTPFSLPPYRDPHPSSFPSTMTPRVCLFFVCFFYLFILLSFSSPPSVCFFYYVLLRLVLHFAVRERE